jgi:hypothetical protein
MSLIAVENVSNIHQILRMVFDYMCSLQFQIL